MTGIPGETLNLTSHADPCFCVYTIPLLTFVLKLPYFVISFPPALTCHTTSTGLATKIDE
jgi:hypothetical protein